MWVEIYHHYSRFQPAHITHVLMDCFLSMLSHKCPRRAYRANGVGQREEKENEFISPSLPSYINYSLNIILITSHTPYSLYTPCRSDSPVLVAAAVTVHFLPPLFCCCSSPFSSSFSCCNSLISTAGGGDHTGWVALIERPSAAITPPCYPRCSCSFVFSLDR